MKKKILAIPGSTKVKSSSLSILKHIAKEYEDLLDLKIYDNIGQLPHFNPDLDNPKNLPKSVTHLRQLIKEADAVLFCTPEYVFSLPAALKNVIEWQVSTVLFSGKSVGMIVAATVGEKAFDSLGLILQTIECILPESSRLLIQGVKGKMDGNGQISDDTVRESIKNMIKSVIESIDEPDRLATKYK